MRIRIWTRRDWMHLYCYIYHSFFFNFSYVYNLQLKNKYLIFNNKLIIFPLLKILKNAVSNIVMNAMPKELLVFLVTLGMYLTQILHLDFQVVHGLLLACSRIVSNAILPLLNVLLVMEVTIWLQMEKCETCVVNNC